MRNRAIAASCASPAAGSGTCFPKLPSQSRYNERCRLLAPKLVTLSRAISSELPGFHDTICLLDTTPLPCGQSTATARRSELAPWCRFGWSAAHSRYFWGFRLYLLCAADGMPVAFELAPANAPEREVAAELLERALQPGQVVVADKGFAGEDFEHFVAALDCRLLRPDRKGEPPRFGTLGGVRQWIESIVETTKGQLSLERHGARTLAGLIARIAQRLLALAAGCWHNWLIGEPGRHFTAYDH